MESLDHFQELAQEMRDEHQSIRATLGRLTKLINDKPKEDKLDAQVNKIRFLLSYFRDRLFHHFQMEEACGIFDDILRLFPEKHLRVEGLRKEHDEIKGSLEDLCKLTKDLDKDKKSVLDTLQKEFEDFAGMFLQHEERETEVIQDAYYTDLGGGQD